MNFEIGYGFRMFPRIKAITNSKMHQNLLKYWFTLRHFVMDDPVWPKREAVPVVLSAYSLLCDALKLSFSFASV